MPIGKEEFFLEIYKDQIAQGRHLEVQRLEVTKFILGASAALLALAGTLKFSVHCLPLCLGIIYLGKFGKRMTKTFIERFEGHMGRARAMRIALDDLVAGGSVQAIFTRNPTVKADRIRDFWLRINGALITVGLLALIWNFGTIVARVWLQSGTIPHRLLSQLALSEK